MANRTFQDAVMHREVKFCHSWQSVEHLML